MRAPSRVWAVAASILLAGSLAACGSDSDDAGTGSPATDPTVGQGSPSPSQTPAAAEATVMTAESDLGTILVDGEGMTLYLFTDDTQGSGESTCEGQCLAAWPPLLGTPTAGAGADADLLGTLTRSDGSTQVSYDGWPLYYWVQDTAAGDTTGQGVENVWWVVSPEGEAIGAS